MCLTKSRTGLVPENPLVVNVLASPKNSWNLQKNTFILFFLKFEGNWVRKSYFRSDLRFYDSFIRRWLETTSILVVIERIYSYQFKSNYKRKRDILLDSFFHFSYLNETSNVLTKDMSLIGQVFLKLLTPKDVLISMLNRPSFWKPFGSERVN